MHIKVKIYYMFIYLFMLLPYYYQVHFNSLLGGTVIFDDGRDVELKAENILINDGGLLQVNTSSLQTRLIYLPFIIIFWGEVG